MLSALKESKHDLYMKAYGRTLQLFIDDPDLPLMPIVTKAIVYGVKAVNSKPEQEFITEEEITRDFGFIHGIMSLMAQLTPSEFMNLYPIAKEYKGHKYEMKDYFYSRDYVKGLADEPIGEKILKFLWEYHNWELTDFNIELMECMSNFRRLNGEPTLAHDFARIMGWKTYQMHKDDKGREFLLDPETGKTAKVKPAKRRHLRIAK